MNHAFTLDDIRNTTKTYEEPLRAVGILFARPNIEIVQKQIISDINYFYHRSGKFIDFFYQVMVHIGMDIIQMKKMYVRSMVLSGHIVIECFVCSLKN